ncbi:MAG: cysteine desulfurase family protein [Candidatus Woesearchaeota archaeon]|nr:cysteine desulfurase family protein [Candidatus Woesearchaeota archaeon]
MKAVYLDNAATTKVRKDVVSAMMPYFSDSFGNASSLYKMGEDASDAVGSARGKIARFLGVKDDEIIFTSGGTESNNLALKGIVCAGDHVIVSKVEHDSILKACKALEKEGVEVSYVGVDKDGKVGVDDVEKALKDNTKLVSVMHANNEVGTLQDIDAIGKICRSHGVLFHTDAVQSFCKVKIDLSNVDLASFSAHKIHGPKGVGGLYVKKGVRLKALLDGGGHEFGYRSGTENVPGIVGFGAAVKMIDAEKVLGLRDRLIEGVLQIDGSWLNGSAGDRLCNNAHFGFKGIEGEALVLKLDDVGIMVSTGSACSSKSLEPSHVLVAMGLSKVDAHGGLRLTLSSDTTAKEIDYVLKELGKAVEELRNP